LLRIRLGDLDTQVKLLHQPCRERGDCIQPRILQVNMLSVRPEGKCKRL